MITSKFSLNIILLFMAIGLLANSKVNAQSNKGMPSTIIKLFSENDFWLFSDSDKYYTQGLLLEVNFKIDSQLPKKSIWKYFDNDETSSGVFLGQNMYTPSDIEVENPSLNERPYAGWTYMGFKLVNNNSVINHRLSTLFHIGVIGSNSKADVVQTWWHDLIRSPEPLGWHRQISNDIGVNLTIIYDRKLEYLSFINRSENARFEFIPRVEIQTGTVFNKAGIGATTILSLFSSDSYFENSMSDIGSIIKDFDPNVFNSYSTNIKSGWGVALYARFSEKVVLHNSMLQGGLFTESIHTINSNNLNRFYFDLDYGVTLNHRKFNITYSRAYRTKEFNQQLQNHSWGQLYFVYKIY